MAHDRNVYLLKNYGITAVRYAEMSVEQGGACKCCGQIPTGLPLHVDHDHTIAKLKIKKCMFEGGPGYLIPHFHMAFCGASMPELLVRAKQWLLAKSVRGLLCWRCNSGLQAFKNKPTILRAAANYLDEFQAKLYAL